MQIIEENSRSLGEFLIIPNFSSKGHRPDVVNLKADLIKYNKNDGTDRLILGAPFVSSIMQSVSGPKLAIALAKEGGLSFIFHSQPIEQQAAMIREVKGYKAGFVESDSNIDGHSSMGDAIAVAQRTGHSTIAITTDGSPGGVFIGLLTSDDFAPDQFDPSVSVLDYATKKADLSTARSGISLEEAYRQMWKNKQRVLPIVTESGNLDKLVFRRDYKEGAEKPNQLIDSMGRLRVGAGINTRDYKERLPALIEAGTDVFCLDSSDGHTEWVGETLEWIKSEYGDSVKVGAGNVVDVSGFDFLVNAGADFVKIGVAENFRIVVAL